MNILILDSTAKTIEAKLMAAPATTNPAFVSCYADNDGTVFAEKSNDGTLNGTTAVTVVMAPASGTRRIVKSLSISNTDSAAVQIVLQLNNGGTARQIYKQTLNVGDTFTLDHTVDINGNTKVTVATGGGGSTDVGAAIVAANAKSTIVDADTIAGINSESGNVLTKWTWANIKTFLASVFVSLAQTTAQTIGTTANRVLKIWTTDLTVTNTIAGSINGSAGKSSNLIGGNSTTLKGSIPYQSDVDVTTLLTPNTTTTKKFLRETGDGTNGTPPAWDIVLVADVSGAAPLASPTFTGVVTIPSLVLPAGSTSQLAKPTSDGSATGNITNAFNCGYSSSAVGDLVYLDSAGTWQKADNTTSATTYGGLLGIALEVKASGNALKVALPGSFVYAAAIFPTFTVGAPVYMSTAAALVVAQPSAANAAIRVIGWGIHADIIFFNPSPDYIVHV